MQQLSYDCIIGVINYFGMKLDKQTTTNVYVQPTHPTYNRTRLDV